MKKYVQHKKVRLNSYLEKKLLKYQEDFKMFNHWGEDSFSRIPEFISRGKMIRGALVYLGYEAFGGKDISIADPLAAAVELLHAGFLIHDDIMDRDELRRGKPAIHVSLRDKFDSSFSDIEKNAENIAICLGNICYFTAFDLIDNIGITKLFNMEAIITGLGQMDDLFLSSAGNIPGHETILNIYRLKTARYTFSLPLKAGAIAAGANLQSLELLNNLGIEIGTLFQMRDDELNFYGDIDKTGKPAGSDIREGKKTLTYSLLLHNAQQKHTEFIKHSLGNPNLNDDDIKKLKKISIDCGAKEKHEKIASEFNLKAIEIISYLDINENSRTVLKDILDYSYKRGY